MSNFVDFGALKEKVPVESAIPLLNLQLKQHGTQFRGACPVCKTGGDRALVVTQGKGFYCFAAKQGGDVIGFASHIKGIAAKDAASFLAQSLSPSPPERNSGKDHGARTIHPLSHLEPDHEEVQKLGISPETAKRFGAGFTSRGMARGNVVAELRDAANNLVAYVGLGPDMWLPKDFDATELVFGMHLIQEGEVYLAATPHQVVTMAESGIENAVAFLTPTIHPLQLRYLAAQLEDRGCVLVL